MRFNFGIITLTLTFAIALTLGGYAQAQNGPTQARIALLNFWAFDKEGNVVPRADEADIARIAAVLPRSIAARLAQSGEFDVYDTPILVSRHMLPKDGTSELDRVEALLATGKFDQVITGSVALIEKSVITSLQRFVAGEDGPDLAGAAVVRSNSPSEVINSVDMLLSQAFPPEAEVVIRPISRIVVVPSVLRIPIGASASLQAYAIDDLGRPIPSANLVYQANDESRATVDSTGHVRGISPGSTTINVQPVGRPIVANTLPSVEVNVIGPSLGMRVGTSVLSGETPRTRVGLRLSPGYEMRTSRTPAQDLPTAGTNPVNYLTSFFGALLGNEMLTLGLDVVPSQDISVTINAMQRTAGGFFGTGIGVTVPLEPNGPGGVNLRLAFGTQLPFAIRQNTTVPLEVNVDFLLGSAQTPPMARMGLALGIDLFQ